MDRITVSAITRTPLKTVNVRGGDVLHVLKVSESSFKGFGEAYFSKIEPQAVKAWKMHKLMHMNLVVPIGQVSFVFVDELGNFREEVIGAASYARLSVPPKIWFGFKGLFHLPSLILNFADIAHAENEVDRKPIGSIPFDWDNKR